MAGTTLSDVIVPSLFDPYVVRRTMELSALYQSGIVQNNAHFDYLASEAAPVHNMPFFEDLKGTAENIIEGKDLTENKITSSKDVSVTIRRGNMWSATDLSAALAGSDPMQAIGNLVAGYWARQMQAELINLLKGVFASSTMVDHVNDISAMSGAAANISASAYIDTLQLLGDAQSDLTATVMHSATKSYLKKKNLITTERDSTDVEFDTYQGRRVVVDDGCPVDTDTGVYTSYLFGQGAIALGNGSPVGFVTTETDRDKKKGSGVDYLINRKTFILHPRGIAWQKVENESPARTDLANGENWKRVFEPKAIRLVAFKHKLG